MKEDLKGFLALIGGALFWGISIFRMEIMWLLRHFFGTGN